MRLHRSTCQAVVDSLQHIFQGNRYADKVVEKTLKQNPKWGARDRHFIAMTTYDIVRWYRLLLFIAEVQPTDYWRLLAAWCIVNHIELPAWNEFSGLSLSGVKARMQEANTIRPVRESIPDWLDALGEEELGAQWESELTALNQEAKVILRVNTLKTGTAELIKRFRAEDIDAFEVPHLPHALELRERKNVFSSRAFADGLFEVQDGASQLVAPFADVKEGMRVIDACAGAGGKTLHLAALMNNKGRIIALDVDGRKLEELQRRARRAGVTNIETRIIESQKTIKRLSGSADRLLLDVPCSGVGVLRRNPDAKWKLSPAVIDQVVQVQADILNGYHDMVRKDGMLVYATCSILPRENVQQVNNFLLSHASFQKIAEHVAWPSMGFDGFYMAKLHKH